MPRITKPNGHFSVLAVLHPSVHLSQLITASSLKQLLHLVSTNPSGCSLVLVSGKYNIAKYCICAHLQYEEYISGINFGQVWEYSKSSVENATKVHEKEEQENRNKVRKSTHRK